MKDKESKLIVSFEPDPSFEEDFSDFVSEVLDFEDEEIKGLKPYENNILY